MDGICDFKRGFSGRFGWEFVGMVSVVGGCVGSDGYSVVIIGGYSDVVFLVWFIIWERRVCGICGGSVIVVSDGFGT